MGYSGDVCIKTAACQKKRLSSFTAVRLRSSRKETLKKDEAEASTSHDASASSSMDIRSEGDYGHFKIMCGMLCCLQRLEIQAVMTLTKSTYLTIQKMNLIQQVEKDRKSAQDISGYNCQPEAKHYYWSTQPDMDAQGAISCISSSRFMEIKKYLYLADNQKLHGMFHEKLSVDESIVPYYGRHAAKLFLKGKSIRFGYKVWLLCGNDGYP
ncbi:Chimeric ERCC6-PGBD3 protein [Trichinella pseudospiralis]